MSKQERTLDPENWQDFKKLGHTVIENSLTQLQEIRDHPNSQMSDDNWQNLLVPLSEQGEGAKKVYEIISDNVLPFNIGYTRPNFWGYVVGTGSPYGVLVDTILSGRNSGAGHNAMVPMWLHTINWIKELLEIPQEYSGVYVSGGSEASYTGLAVARHVKSEVDMKKHGMQSVKHRMVLYGSKEMHHCLERSVELLGFGNEALRWIPVDDQFRINIDELEKAIKEDKQKGLHPICVIGNAGTVNSGAFDDFNALADIASKHDLWFHIDGAFGAWVRITEKYKYLADGLDRANSIGVDLHKWMNMQYPIGITLVKDKLAHYGTFVYGHEAKYLETAMADLDLDSNTIWSSLALSRENFGLKVYMLLRAFGKQRYRDIVQQNIEDVHYFAGLLKSDPCFEITAPVVSNIVCFRYNPGGLSEEQVEALNRKLLAELWKTVMFRVSDTTLDGKYTLRVCNVNHRSRREDFDNLALELKTVCNTL